MVYCMSRIDNAYSTIVLADGQRLHGGAAGMLVCAEVHHGDGFYDWKPLAELHGV